MSGKCRASLRAKTLENVKRSLLSQADKNCIAEVFERYEKASAVIDRLEQNLKEAHIDIREHLAEIDRLTAVEESHKKLNGELRKEINRLKSIVLAFTNEAVIDRNGYYIKELSYEVITENARKCKDELRAEAIKEVIERLKLDFGDDWGIVACGFDQLDQIAKEMGVSL